MQSKTNGRTVLVVEDDNISRTLLRELLKNKDITLHFENTGQGALDYISKNPLPNLILMDIRLPDISGVDIAKEILEKHPEVIIVAQTAFANMSMEENCMKVGMKAFLTKPLQRSMVEKVIETYLG
ncbi:MAG: response regulator [Bacteroidales bacterium]